VKVAVIGGGAAGFFAAIQVKDNHPRAEVDIYEKSSRLLAKVKISGGGRCNLTHACDTSKELAAHYPRGGNSLKKVFRHFDNHAAISWFENHQVPLVRQEDNCIFPHSQDSQSVIDCFMREAAKRQIRIKTDTGIKALKKTANGLLLHFSAARQTPVAYDKVIVATGGSPQRSGLDWLAELGHTIVEPVPALFTFSLGRDQITELTGIVVDHALLALQGSPFRSEGTLLVTHWGFSGPAILKLSSFAARWLSEQHYHAQLQLNWVGERNQDRVLRQLTDIAARHPKKMLISVRPADLPERLFSHLLEKCGLSPDKRWGELGKHGLNRLLNVLSNDCYTITGKGQFKEEFVTCGGISLNDVDFSTMQSKVCPNLYFAGEVLDIDGLTGGFNFQAAWSTAFVAAKLA